MLFEQSKPVSKAVEHMVLWAKVRWDLEANNLGTHRLLFDGGFVFGSNWQYFGASGVESGYSGKYSIFRFPFAGYSPNGLFYYMSQTSLHTKPTTACFPAGNQSLLKHDWSNWEQKPESFRPQSLTYRFCIFTQRIGTMQHFCLNVSWLLSS